jgi:hypothetical protein
VDVGDVVILKFDIYWRALDSARAINCWISSFRSRSSLKRNGIYRWCVKFFCWYGNYFRSSCALFRIWLIISRRSAFSSSRIFIWTCNDSLFAFSVANRRSNSLI